jgi:hypothetical protein
LDEIFSLYHNHRFFHGNFPSAQIFESFARGRPSKSLSRRSKEHALLIFVFDYRGIEHSGFRALHPVGPFPHLIVSKALLTPNHIRLWANYQCRQMHLAPGNWLPNRLACAR